MTRTLRILKIEEILTEKLTQAMNLKSPSVSADIIHKWLKVTQFRWYILSQHIKRPYHTGCDSEKLVQPDRCLHLFCFFRLLSSTGSFSMLSCVPGNNYKYMSTYARLHTHTPTHTDAHTRTPVPIFSVWLLVIQLTCIGLFFISAKRFEQSLKTSI